MASTAALVERQKAAGRADRVNTVCFERTRGVAEYIDEPGGRGKRASSKRFPTGAA